MNAEKMKKKKLIGILLTIFSLGFMTNTNAEERTSDFINVNKLCVIKKENRLAIKFDLVTDIDLTNKNAILDISIRSTNNEYLGGACINEGCESDGTHLHTWTFDGSKIENTDLNINLNLKDKFLLKNKDKSFYGFVFLCYT